MAVAYEQEMKAKAEEARANVIQAEAEVPKAMADCFQKWKSRYHGLLSYEEIFRQIQPCGKTLHIQIITRQDMNLSVNNF